MFEKSTISVPAWVVSREGSFHVRQWLPFISVCTEPTEHVVARSLFYRSTSPSHGSVITIQLTPKGYILIQHTADYRDRINLKGNAQFMSKTKQGFIPKKFQCEFS